MPASSLEGLETPHQDRVAVWGRRLVLTAILALVLAGGAGLLGVRAGTVSSTESGWSLDVGYAQVARAGLDVPLQATVTHAGGFSKPIVLALTGAYLDIFETQGFHPEPSAETRDGGTLFLTFDPPPDGDTFVVACDAYIQPSSQRGRAGTMSVVSGGQRLASVKFTTRLFP
jgi:hypothetical protein